VIEVIVSLTLLLSNQGYTNKEINCTMNLVKVESNFHLHSKNSKSGAYGLFQLMNAPFDEHPEFEAHYTQPPPSWAKALCISCSS
jgi:uncharacterized protein YdiU (UPF0061 family)